MAVHKEQRRLSIASLNEWIKDLEIRQKKYPKIAVKIADRLADEMMKTFILILKKYQQN